MAIELTAEQKAALSEQKQYCPFCKIVSGEIPAQKVYEDADVIVVLDINPAVPGHAILIPKEHVPVLPFIEDRVQERLATLFPQLAQAMSRAMLTRGTELLIANGPAAGQQASHFLVHLFPVDQSLFELPQSEHAQAAAMRTALAARYGDPKERLTRLLSANQELRRMLIEQPEEFARQLPSAPDVARLFAGVDPIALGLKLMENDPPRAQHTEDAQLVRYIESKPRLKEMLLADLATLEMAIEAQPRLKQFFTGTTPAAVAQRYRDLATGGAP